MDNDKEEKNKKNGENNARLNMDKTDIKGRRKKCNCMEKKKLANRYVFSFFLTTYSHEEKKKERI